MSDHPHEPPDRSDGTPRLGPRPVERPAVDESAEAVFGRPSGVHGSFGDRGDTGATAQGDDRITAQTPPPESLAEAFAPSEHDADGGLQRPPEQTDGDEAEHAAPLWGASQDPWRSPGASAVLGTPAVTESSGTDDVDEPKRPGVALSLTEAVFGKRLRRSALLVLAVTVLLIGAVGGVIGWFLGQGGSELNRDVTLSQTQSGKERAPESVANTVEEVAPAVVSIEVKSGSSGGVGSGVVIDEDGYIVTNHHVIAAAEQGGGGPQEGGGQGDEDNGDSNGDEGGSDLAAVFTDGTRADARVVGSDPKTDLAVIKVEVTNPTVLQLGESSSLAAGDDVIAVGSPFGLDNTVTVGIVSAVNRPVTAPAEGDGEPVTFDAIQTDAAINPGNSGGALVDSEGLLVGINSLIRTVGNAQGEGGSIGLGFAIAVDDVVSITESLIEDGSVAHPTLGVRAASVAANTSQGAQVNSVVNDGPADGKGIREGDVITEVGDRMVRNAAELTVAVRQHDVGEVVEVSIQRGGREMVVDVELGSD